MLKHSKNNVEEVFCNVNRLKFYCLRRKGKLCDCAENRKENLFLGQLNYDYSSFNHFHLAGSTGYYDKADLFTRESL